MALPTQLKICISLATSWGVRRQWTVWFTQQPVSFDNRPAWTHMVTGSVCVCACVRVSFLNPSLDLVAGKKKTKNFWSHTEHAVLNLIQVHLTRLAWAWKHVARHTWTHSIIQECTHTHTHTHTCRVSLGVQPVMLAALHTNSTHTCLKWCIQPKTHKGRPQANIKQRPCVTGRFK